MKTHWGRSIVIALIVAAFVGGLFGGLVLDQAGRAAGLLPHLEAAAQSPDYKLIGEAWDAINRVYVDRKAVDVQQLTYGAITGMTDALGDTGHSRFLTPDMLREETSYVQGKFQGIGAEVEMKDGAVTIVAPFDNSPAQKAGLRPGDVIAKVDGLSLMGLSLHDAIQHILGPAGTQVTLTVLTPKTGKIRDITVTRQEITIKAVTWQLLPGTGSARIAHLRISSFSQSTTSDLRQALTDMQQQGVTGIILDLRNNPGGLLERAVEVASQFLSTGSVVRVRDANGKENILEVKPGGLATTMPLTVLINGGTASAAEIVSGALQDAHRARLFGGKTFGTGTVLQQYKLSDGSALLLATGEWLTPAGRVIWHNGIAPDVEVALDPNVTPLLPETERSLSAADIQASQDDPLLRALDALTKPVLPEAQTAPPPGRPVAVPGG
jgi:carboxyl-terminal processing protease